MGAHADARTARTWKTSYFPPAGIAGYIGGVTQPLVLMIQCLLIMFVTLCHASFTSSKNKCSRQGRRSPTHFIAHVQNQTVLFPTKCTAQRTPSSAEVTPTPTDLPSLSMSVRLTGVPLVAPGAPAGVPLEVVTLETPGAPAGVPLVPTPTAGAAISSESCKNNHEYQLFCVIKNPRPPTSCTLARRHRVNSTPPSFCEGLLPIFC